MSRYLVLALLVAGCGKKQEPATINEPVRVATTPQAESPKPSVLLDESVPREKETRKLKARANGKYVECYRFFEDVENYAVAAGAQSDAVDKMIKAGNVLFVADGVRVLVKQTRTWNDVVRCYVLDGEYAGRDVWIRVVSLSEKPEK